MIDHIKNSCTKALAGLLVIVLVLPATLGMQHMLEQHDHVDRCDNPSLVHLHKKQFDCNLYDILLDNAVTYAFAKAELSTPPPPVYQIEKRPVAIINGLETTILLRGPPQC